MKFLKPILIAACAATMVTAHADLDNSSSVRLRAERSRVPLSRADSDEEEAQPTHYPAILMIDDDATLQRVQSLGVVIYYNRENLYLTAVPESAVDEINADESIVCGGLLSECNATMDLARGYSFNPSVTDPQLLSYDGSGVVTGFSDIGFDPHHIAFSNGKTAGISHYNLYFNNVIRAESPSEISNWQMPASLNADTSHLTHATHVGNIMAGNYRGNALYGTAPGSLLFASTSSLVEAEILCGVEDVIACAKANSMPAVVNLSLSSNLGAHDGTDLMCRYLSLCAQDAVICVSSGNDGYRSNSARALLSADNPSECVSLNTYSGWDCINVKGMVEIWASTDSPIEFRYEVYDRDTSEIIYTSDLVTAENSHLIINDEDNADWAQLFSGKIIVASGVSPLNNRYNISFYCDTKSTELGAGTKWGRYIHVLTVNSDHSDAVDFFADGSGVFLTQTPVKGRLIPGNTMSINNLATADGIMSVGACSSRNSAPRLDDSTFSWSFDTNNVASFTSYSSQPSIGAYPHICAPGNYVVSAVTDAYFNELGAKQMSAVTTVDGTNHYWAPMCGTSMSSPFAAGVVAIWLQANPDLTAHEVIEIAQSTARTDFPDIDNPRWGAGCIDAIAGLQKVLNEKPGSLVSLPTAPSTPIVTIVGRKVLLTYPTPGNSSSGSSTGNGYPTSNGYPSAGNGSSTSSMGNSSSASSANDNGYSAPQLFSVSGSPAPFNTDLTPGIYILHLPSASPTKLLIR